MRRRLRARFVLGALLAAVAACGSEADDGGEGGGGAGGSAADSGSGGSAATASETGTATSTGTGTGTAIGTGTSTSTGTGTGTGTATATGEPVECEEANIGDPCANPGDSCDNACTPCQYVCTPEHVWKEDCNGCPDNPPEPGDECVPCAVAGPCEYAGVETACGFVPGTATCDLDSMTWQIDTECDQPSEP